MKQEEKITVFQELDLYLPLPRPLGSWFSLDVVSSPKQTMNSKVKPLVGTLSLSALPVRKPFLQSSLSFLKQSLFFDVVLQAHIFFFIANQFRCTDPLLFY